MPKEFVKVAKAGDITPGKMRLIKLGRERILLVNLGGHYHAVDDECTHASASLSDGELTGEEVECPLHGSAFNVKTGKATSPPADEPVKTYAVRVQGNDILVGPAS